MNLETRVTAVAVYPDRARLTRQGRIELDPGLHRLEITGLSVRMDPDSARVTARGSAQARLLGIQVHPAFYAETPAEAVRELEKQVEIARDELTGIERQLARLEQSGARLDDIAGHTEMYAAALAAGEQSVEDQLALFERLGLRRSELDREALTLEAQKRTSERRLKQLQAQLDQTRSLRPPARYTAEVEVEILQAGDFQVDVSYVVSGAGWKPLYDLRLDEAAQPPQLEIGYLAQVTQSSGEDWRDVALSLSTARPALAAQIPELEPWFIRPLSPPRPHPAAPAAKMAMMRSPAPEMAEPGSAAMDEFSAYEAVASVESAGAAVSYGIPGLATIPPDGAAHKVVIARYPLAPVLDYVSAPALVPAVYRRARVINRSAYTLLPGTVNLFAGDEFLGATRLEITPPQGEFEVFLGVDDRLPVERELLRRDVDKTLVSGRRRVRYAYEIRLENRLAAKVNVSLRDQFPVSRHEEVKVRLDQVDPRPTSQNELNQMDWDLTLAPNEKRVVRFDFLVEHPATMEIDGLGE